MDRRPARQLDEARRQLNEAEEELIELKRQLEAFESRVDAQLGSLLDQLSELNIETAALDAQLRQIREQRLFGQQVMRYVDGAPQARHQPDLDDLPPMGFSKRDDIHAEQQPPAGLKIPDIKGLYRKLARRYHPDLARSDADRAASNEQMAEINRAYQAGDLKALMKIAGIALPYGAVLPPIPRKGGPVHGEALSELEQVQAKLKAAREQIGHMSGLPIIRLSLEVKLARHQGRDLLREMAADLQYKVGRKLAERDYLQAQIRASGG